MHRNSIALIGSWFALVAATAAAAPIPLENPSFEAGLTGWHTGIGATESTAAPGYSIDIDRDRPRAGAASLRLESAPATEAGFGTITSSVDATPYRGRRVRLTGAVRAIPADDGKVGLWLRVDRPDGQRGFFDNMDRQPITGSNWADYSIEGDVAADATRVVFGLLLVGHGRAWLDDVRLDDIGPARGTGIPIGWGNRPRAAQMAGDVPPRPLSPRGLTNLAAFAQLYGLIRFFHPSDEAAAADWDSLAIAGVARVEPARTSAELARDLRAIFSPVAPSIEISASRLPPAMIVRPQGAVDAVRWHHVGYGDDPGHVYSSKRIAARSVGPAYTVALPGGVSARIPLALWRDATGATLPHASTTPASTGKPAAFVPAGFDRTTRLAAVAAAWAMYGQFFPYFDQDSRARWRAALTPTLREAAHDADDLAFHDTLRRLIARLHDGHAMVPYYEPPRGALPLAWDWVQGQLVITATGSVAKQVKPGDVVVAIDGMAARHALARKAALESGSPQWTRFRGLDDLLMGPVDGPARITLKGPSGLRNVVLRYGKAGDGAEVIEARPEPLTELRPGLFYVDLDRVTQSGFDARIPDLAKVRGLIFDLRGYPRMSPAFLQHLSDKPLRSAHFISLAFDHPDRPGVRADDGQWTLQPLAPRFTKNIVFITNGSAISYSESVLSVVAGNHLADIVGSPSAGANGNITFFDLPGGYQVSWTGMKVTNADGSRHYLRGIQPTVPVARTIAGVRASRDELLDRAIELVRTRMAAAN